MNTSTYLAIFIKEIPEPNSEKSGLVAFILILAIVALGFGIRVLWKKIEQKDNKINMLGETFLEALNNNTKVLTKIDEKLDRH